MANIYLFKIILFATLPLLFPAHTREAIDTVIPVQSPLQQTITLTGAWELESTTDKNLQPKQGIRAVKLVTEDHFTVAFYNRKDNSFIGTYGGTYTFSDGQYEEHFEFNTFDSTRVGTSLPRTLKMQKNKLQMAAVKNNAAKQEVWTRIKEDKGSPLTGTWRITGRAGEDGTVNRMQPGPRKTYKILAGDRFQWIAFNTETKQFSGTGGGTYSAQNGKYTEKIEFFSRDPERVGAQLSFNFEVKNGEWHHSGESSTGNPIYEIWTLQ